jgi:hypothetical protein
MKKKSLFATIFVFAGLLVYGQSAEDFEVLQNTDGKTISIIGYNGTLKDVIIPEKLYGLPVTIIREGAFSRKGLTSVVIPDSVTTISSATTANKFMPFFGIQTDYSNGAFESNELTSIIIGNSVTTIGGSAFSGNQLTSVTIPNSVTTIGWSAFSNNQLTSVILGSGLVDIGGSAFGGNQLISVTIPNSVTTIGGSAFSGNQLTSVILGSGLVDIGGSAFGGNQLTSVTIPNSVTSIGESAFSGNQLTSVTISNSVTTIWKSAFSDNQLTSITIPDSVTTIEDGAFSDNQLTSIILGKGLVNIGQGAFSGNQLTSITITKDVKGEKITRGSTFNPSYRFSSISTETGFDQNFLNFYESQERTPGTYVKNGPIWSKTETESKPEVQSAPAATNSWKIGSPGPNGGLVYFVDDKTKEYYEAILPGNTVSGNRDLPKGWINPDMEDLELIYNGLQKSGVADYGNAYYYSISKKAGKNRFLRMSDGKEATDISNGRKLGVRKFDPKASPSTVASSALVYKATETETH